MKTKPILIIAGEPYSVFLEIFFKSIAKKKYKNPLVLIVSKKLLLKQMKLLKYDLKINLLDKKKPSFNILNNNYLNIIDVDFKFNKTFDKITKKSNAYINECFDIGIKLIKENVCLGLINGPISKKNFLKEKFLGITEYLADKTSKKNNVVMLIYNKKLSVAPITTHLPLKNVHKQLSKEKIINQIKLLKEFYITRFGIEPRIAVTGLNPHCESNYKSSEEKKIIIPAIKYLLNKKYKIKGPFSADTIFMKEQSKKFDIIVGMYHDQVLSPIKTLYGFNSINITLGLPFIRISPDHGPNTPMLGKNKSNPQSLIKALEFLDR